MEAPDRNFQLRVWQVDAHTALAGEATLVGWFHATKLSLYPRVEPKKLVSDGLCIFHIHWMLARFIDVYCVCETTNRLADVRQILVWFLLTRRDMCMRKVVQDFVGVFCDAVCWNGPLNQHLCPTVRPKQC